MSVFTEKGAITVTCPKRLSPYLEQEIKELGFQPELTFVTGVKLTGTVNDCIKLNLNLRCASQVLYSVKQFEAEHPDTIYQNLVNFPWENFLPDDGYFSITSNVNNPTINNSMYANLRVKDAIVDRLREKRGVRRGLGAQPVFQGQPHPADPGQKLHPGQEKPHHHSDQPAPPVAGHVKEGHEARHQEDQRPQLAPQGLARGAKGDGEDEKSEDDETGAHGEFGRAEPKRRSSRRQA